MKPRILLLLTLLLISAQDSPPIALTFPAQGAIIGGAVTIKGTTDILGFTSSHLDFSYASNPTETWFSIQTSSQPVIDSALAVWDTTLISDGDYVLRLRVHLSDGTFQEFTTQVKIQNDAPILTPTPVVTPTSNRINDSVPTPFLVASSPTPTPTLHPSPTPLPTNAVSLNQAAINSSLGHGALVMIGLFILAGIILRFRRY